VATPKSNRAAPDGSGFTVLDGHFGRDWGDRGRQQAQGRYSEAEPLYKRSLLICEQQLGADHPNTVTSLNNLAALYQSQGRYSKAEALFTQLLLGEIKVKKGKRKEKKVSCKIMHIISRKTLRLFWEQYPDTQSSLLRWLKIMQQNDYQSFDALRSTLPSADKVGDLIIFNIGGNKYRLITSIHFNRVKVYIRHILTHKEYDRGEWKI